VLVGAALPKDSLHKRARRILEEIAGEPSFTTDHVLVEAWAVVNSRRSHHHANQLWFGLRHTALRVEIVGVQDLERGQWIAESWPDHEFDIVDCTSFAVLERVGCTRVATFDRDFAVYRFGPDRKRAFEIVS